MTRESRSTRAVVVQPLDVDAVRTVQVGTALWAVAFVVLLPFTDRLQDDDRMWWLWTCAVGVALGVVGIFMTTRRRSRLRARQTPARPAPR